MKPLPEIRLMPTRPVLDARPLEKRVGLIILATDHTSEPDFRRMVASERIGVYVARIPYKNPTTPENLRKMQPELAAGAALILPDETLDAICYSCTSASVVIGDAGIEAAIQLPNQVFPWSRRRWPRARAVALGAKKSHLTPCHGRDQPADGAISRRGFGVWFSLDFGRPRDGATRRPHLVTWEATCCR